VTRPQSFGTGWLLDVIRGRFDVQGPNNFPVDLEEKARVVMEARPSLPWEYGNARWLPVSGVQAVAAGGAGTFAAVDVSVAAAAQRALIIRRCNFGTGGNNTVGLYLNRGFVAPATGPAMLDGRYVAAGSWFTPVADWGLAGSTPAALPAIGTRAWDVFTLANENRELFDSPESYILVLPGQTVALFNETANVSMTVAIMGLLVPVTDLGD